MKKTLLALSLLAAAVSANAGFASGFANGSAVMGQAMDNERQNQQAGRDQARYEQEQRDRANAKKAKDLQMCEGMASFAEATMDTRKEGKTLEEAKATNRLTGASFGMLQVFDDITTNAYAINDISKLESKQFGQMYYKVCSNKVSAQ